MNIFSLLHLVLLLPESFLILPLLILLQLHFFFPHSVPDSCISDSIFLNDSKVAFPDFVDNVS